MIHGLKILAFHSQSEGKSNALLTTDVPIRSAIE